MSCKSLNKLLHDYLDGDLDDAVRAELDQHVSECANCQQIIESERNLRKLLAEFGESTVPQPDAAFYDRAIARAIHSGLRRQRTRWVMTGFGGAIAALFVVWVVSGVFFTAAEIDEPAIPSVTMALEAPRTLNLVFASAKAISGASMTVKLPDGIEIQGYAGQREITWRTSLKEGKNILPLTLIATSSVGGELLATLQHGDDDKIFRLQVTVI